MSQTMQRATCDRRDARRDFIATHAHTIHRLARECARDDGMRREASDVAQQVALRLLQGTLDPQRLERAEAYLFTVVRRASHRTRARRAGRELLSSDGTAPDVIDESFFDGDAADAYLAVERGIDGSRRIDRLRDRLRPRDADALALLLDVENPVADTASLAKALGTNANNVYQMRHRIGCAVQALIDEEEPPQTIPCERETAIEQTLPSGAYLRPSVAKTIPCPPPEIDDEGTATRKVR